MFWKLFSGLLEVDAIKYENNGQVLGEDRDTFISTEGDLGPCIDRIEEGFTIEQLR